jgi:hypothetical protein
MLVFRIKDKVDPDPRQKLESPSAILVTGVGRTELLITRPTPFRADFLNEC